MSPQISAPSASPLPRLEQAPSLRCPLCDYDLRGLVEPRCPECGYAAESWDVLRERIRTSHPWLFEHHPERNAASLVRTLLAGLNPFYFWRSVQPHHAVRVRRLAVYWLMSNLLVLGALVPLYAHACLELHRFNVAQSAGVVASFKGTRAGDQLVQQHGSLEAAAAHWHPDASQPRLYWQAYAGHVGLRAATVLLVTFAVWPWVVVLAMQVFRTTLRTAKVRPGHVVRCAVYACDVLAATFAPLLLAYAAWLWLRPPPPVLPMNWAPHANAIVLALACAIAGAAGLALVTLRLGVALRRYLRLRHAVTTAVLVQVVVFLSIATLSIILENW